MARPPATPEQKAAVRRKIRQAAADVYNSEGPGGVSARAIAKQADVSVGTIYTYFGNLQGLMESLWSGPVARYTEQLNSVAEEIKHPLLRIEALMREYIEFAFSNREIYRGVFMFVRPLGQEHADKTPAADAVFPSLVIQAIREGQASKKIKQGDPIDLAMIVWGGLHGCYALPNNFGRLDFGDTRPVLDLYVKTLISSLRP